MEKRITSSNDNKKPQPATTTSQPQTRPPLTTYRDSETKKVK